MRTAYAFLVFALGMVAAAAAEVAVADGAAPAAKGQPTSRGSLPQPGTRWNGPVLNATVITESTEIGLRLPAPTADQPAYVVTHSGGQHDFGQVPAAETATSAEILDQRLGKALGEAHYLPTDASHPPSLLIVFSWGIHCRPGDEIGDPGYRNVLDRAALVGGLKFASELKNAIEKEEAIVAATSTQPWGAQMPGLRTTSAASMFQSRSPLEAFRKRDAKTEQLVQQITDDCYYVIISAFDYSSVMHGKKQLLWRSKLTVAARGASMATAIPALVDSGAAYAGRNMSGPEFFSTRGH